MHATRRLCATSHDFSSNRYSIVVVVDSHSLSSCKHDNVLFGVSDHLRIRCIINESKSQYMHDKYCVDEREMQIAVLIDDLRSKKKVEHRSRLSNFHHNFMV